MYSAERYRNSCFVFQWNNGVKSVGKVSDPNIKIKKTFLRTCCHVKVNKSDISTPPFPFDGSINPKGSQKDSVQPVKSGLTKVAYTLKFETPKSPLGSVVRMNEDRAIAARRAIMHDEANANPLLTRE